MKINVIQFRGGLFGSLPDDEEAISKMKQGDIYSFEFTKPRNGKFHRKYMALLTIVLNNSDDYINIEQIIHLMKLKLGLFETIINTNGVKTYKTGSISYAAMDDLEFEKFYNDSIKIILRDFLTNWQEPDIDRAINEVIRF